MAHQHAFKARHAGRAFFLRLHAVEDGARFGRRRERVVRVALNRSQQPVAKLELVRNHLAGAPGGERRVDDVDQLRGILVVFQHAAQDQRQRDRADLQDVDAVIELRHTGRSRQADAQALPVMLMGVAQLLERGAQHVIGDDHLGVRVDDDAFGPERAVRQIAVVRMKRVDGRENLTCDAEHRAEFERDAALRDAGKEPRKTHAVDGIRHDGERARLEPLEVSNLLK